MFKDWFKRLSRRESAQAQQAPGVFQIEPPASIAVEGVEPFNLARSLTVVNGLPVPDWPAVSAWVANIADPAAQAQAWANAELGWLAHLQAALGPDYHLAQHEYAVLLSPLEPRVATATVEFMSKTLARIQRVLDGVAKAPAWGRDILLVFHDEDTYYQYVARYYADDGEFAFSSGMHVNFGCGHFATFQDELRSIEPVIAHEMTHSCLGHLDIPAWLNEGLAVNTERRLCPPLARQYTPAQLHWMHQQFWNPERIQEFWSGKSFLRPDEGNVLSYELARILVEQFAADWTAFRAFSLDANMDDAGHTAAARHLGVDLGHTVCALFEFEASPEWAPRPQAWTTQPERGAFRRAG